MMKSIGYDSQVEMARSKVERAAKAMHIALVVLLGCAFALAIANLAAVLERLANPMGREGKEVLDVAGVLPPCVLGVVLVVLIFVMLKDATIARAPFSGSQARRLAAIGAILLLCALFDAVPPLLEAGFCHSGKPVEITELLVWLDALSTDFLLILAAIVSFYFSYLFKYGSYLQLFYDETA